MTHADRDRSERPVLPPVYHGTAEPVGADPERVERYAEALWRADANRWPESHPFALTEWDEEAHAAIAVADAEQVALRARLKATEQAVDSQSRLRVTAERQAERAEANAEDFEGRYEVAHDSRMHAERCLEAAEAERDRLAAVVAKVRARATAAAAADPMFAYLEPEDILAILDAPEAPE